MIDVDVHVHCDICNTNLSDGDSVYCHSCYDEKYKEIEKLQEENETFRKILLHNGIDMRKAPKAPPLTDEVLVWRRAQVN